MRFSSRRGDADAAVAHAHGQPRVGRCRRQLDGDAAPAGPEYLTALSSRFDTAAFSSSASPSDRSADAVRQRVAIGRARRRQVMPRARDVRGTPDERAAGRPARGASARWRGRRAGAQHLLDGSQQPVAVLEHHPVELLPLRRRSRSRALQRLEVQADRRDRRLQLVGDGVDEARRAARCAGSRARERWC